MFLNKPQGGFTTSSLLDSPSRRQCAHSSNKELPQHSLQMGKSRVRKFERSDGVNLGEDLTSSSTNSTVSCVGSTCGLTNKDSRRLHVEAVNALKSILLSSSIVSESILVVVSVEDVSMPETPRRLEKDIAASRSSPCKVSSSSSATAIGGVLRSMMKRDPGRSWKPL